MGWTTPPTAVSGGGLGSASFNAGVRDNLLFLTNPPTCDLYLSAAQNAASGTSYASVAFDTEAADTDTMHSTSSNTSRITATTAGLYLVTGTVAFAANATGYRGARIAKNGSTDVTRTQSPATAAATAHWLNIAALVRLAAGDYVELQALQNSGGNLALTTGVGGTSFQAIWQSL